MENKRTKSGDDQRDSEARHRAIGVLDDTRNGGYNHEDMTKQGNDDRDANCVVTTEVSIRNIGTIQWCNVTPANMFQVSDGF